MVYTVTAQDGSTKRYTVIVNSSFTLYAAGQDSYLYALDAVTGKVKWKYFVNVPAVTGPTFEHGQVFICTRGNYKPWTLPQAKGNGLHIFRLPEKILTPAKLYMLPPGVKDHKCSLLMQVPELLNGNMESPPLLSKIH